MGWPLQILEREGMTPKIGAPMISAMQLRPQTLGWLFCFALLASCGGDEDLAPTPLTLEDCDDADPCTVDSLVDNACVFTPREDTFFACDGEETVLGCFDGELETFSAVDLFLLSRAQSDRVWGFSGCEEDGAGGITIGSADQTNSF
ncbi:MAG: hypothetical protein AAF658_18795, partial [Myxococcota bacterium]